MSDLISRQAAIDAMSDTWKHICYVARRKHPTKGEEAVYRDMCGTINRVPSAQPERKKGKLVLHPEVKNIYGGICIECSECHTKYVVQHIEDEKYCRNCGAKMECFGETDARTGNKSEK